MDCERIKWREPSSSGGFCDNRIIRLNGKLYVVNVYVYKYVRNKISDSRQEDRQGMSVVETKTLMCKSGVTRKTK